MTFKKSMIRKTAELKSSVEKAVVITVAQDGLTFKKDVPDRMMRLFVPQNCIDVEFDKSKTTVDNVYTDLVRVRANKDQLDRTLFFRKGDSFNAMPYKAERRVNEDTFIVSPLFKKRVADESEQELDRELKELDLLQEFDQFHFVGSTYDGMKYQEGFIGIYVKLNTDVFTFMNNVSEGALGQLKDKDMKAFGLMYQATAKDFLNRFPGLLSGSVQKIKKSGTVTLELQFALPCASRVTIVNGKETRGTFDGMAIVTDKYLKAIGLYGKANALVRPGFLKGMITGMKRKNMEFILSNAVSILKGEELCCIKRHYDKDGKLINTEYLKISEGTIVESLLRDVDLLFDSNFNKIKNLNQRRFSMEILKMVRQYKLSRTVSEQMLSKVFLAISNRKDKKEILDNIVEESTEQAIQHAIEACYRFKSDFIHNQINPDFDHLTKFKYSGQILDSIIHKMNEGKVFMENIFQTLTPQVDVCGIDVAHEAFKSLGIEDTHKHPILVLNSKDFKKLAAFLGQTNRKVLALRYPSSDPRGFVIWNVVSSDEVIDEIQKIRVSDFAKCYGVSNRQAKRIKTGVKNYYANMDGKVAIPEDHPILQMQAGSDNDSDSISLILSVSVLNAMLDVKLTSVNCIMPDKSIDDTELVDSGDKVQKTKSGREIELFKDFVFRYYKSLMTDTNGIGALTSDAMKVLNVMTALIEGVGGHEESKFVNDMIVKTARRNRKVVVAESIDISDYKQVTNSENKTCGYFDYINIDVSKKEYEQVASTLGSLKPNVDVSKHSDKILALCWDILNVMLWYQGIALDGVKNGYQQPSVTIVFGALNVITKDYIERTKDVVGESMRIDLKFSEGVLSHTARMNVEVMKNIERKIKRRVIPGCGLVIPSAPNAKAVKRAKSIFSQIKEMVAADKMKKFMGDMEILIAAAKASNVLYAVNRQNGNGEETPFCGEDFDYIKGACYAACKKIGVTNREDIISFCYYLWVCGFITNKQTKDKDDFYLKDSFTSSDVFYRVFGLDALYLTNKKQGDSVLVQINTTENIKEGNFDVVDGEVQGIKVINKHTVVGQATVKKDRILSDDASQAFEEYEIFIPVKTDVYEGKFSIAVAADKENKESVVNEMNRRGNSQFHTTMAYSDENERGIKYAQRVLSSLNIGKYSTVPNSKECKLNYTHTFSVEYGYNKDDKHFRYVIIKAEK